MRSVKAVLGVCVLAAALALTGAAPVAASADPPGGHFTGTLPDGATWIADVPAKWNGILLLYSHGFGPLTAADAPDPTTAGGAAGPRLRAGRVVVRPERVVSGRWTPR